VKFYLTKFTLWSYNSPIKRYSYFCPSSEIASHLVCRLPSAEKIDVSRTRVEIELLDSISNPANLICHNVATSDGWRIAKSKTKNKCVINNLIETWESECYWTGESGELLLLLLLSLLLLLLLCYRASCMYERYMWWRYFSNFIFYFIFPWTVLFFLEKGKVYCVNINKRLNISY